MSDHIPEELIVQILSRLAPKSLLRLRCLHLPMPPPECNQKGRPFSVFGFGFDTKSKDYKVVKMTYVQSRYTCLVPPKVEIFALSRGSWKQFNGFIPEICIMEQLYKQAVVQGKIHWIGYKIDRERKKVKNLILAFDLSDEIFVELQLPDHMVFGPPPIEMNTAEFGESLAIYHYNSHPWTWTCSIWVMKEYGVVESWNKEFNVPLDPKPGMVLGFRNEGEILLTSSTGQLVSYNPRTHEDIDFGIIGTKNSFFIGSYEESLILLNEGEPVIPNDFSSETDQDECKENDIDKENAQISGVWTQLAIRHYLTAVLDARNI
ncbi:hypothetical protein HAX54_028689 [Datura stramonium]|uniref:F-box associated beta-propeller type 1 domain-containing protein n=1 Tax=Datura stramonium TaxID=4076 RepID=A0ABS8S9S0_DATST|nr:hypothetical protein [Datura stramonium]